MDVKEIRQTLESIQELDEDRREAFRQESRQVDEDGVAVFPETRGLIEAEREELDRLGELLAAEQEQIEELVDYTEFLTVDQAVRHRDRAVEKLRTRNKHLVEFHREMVTALDIIESNLDALEKGDEDAMMDDHQDHLEAAMKALEAHNEAVEGLEDNMEILNAYLA